MSDHSGVEPISSAPRYMTLAETLRSGIASGHPAVGELLPTEHALTEQYGVSRHTVHEALRLLAAAPAPSSSPPRRAQVSPSVWAAWMI